MRYLKFNILFKSEYEFGFSRHLWGTDGQSNGRTVRRTDGRMDELTDGRADGRTDGRTYGRTDELTDGRTDG